MSEYPFVEFGYDLPVSQGYYDKMVASEDFFKKKMVESDALWEKSRIDATVRLAILKSTFGACRVDRYDRPGHESTSWAVYPGLIDLESGKRWYQLITLSKTDLDDKDLEALIAQKVKAAEFATNNAKQKMLERQEKPAAA